MKREIFTLMLLTTLSKVLGFARDLILSYYYGASNISDAFLISQTIPTVIFTFIGTGISTGYIPIYKKIIADEGKSVGIKFTNNLLNFTLILCFILSIIGLCCADIFVNVFAKGFSDETHFLAVQFLKISIFAIVFLGILNIYNGYLQSNDDFNSPAISVFPMNIIIIVSTIISYYTNILVMVIGGVFATFIQVLYLKFMVRHHGYKHKLSLDLNDKYLHKFILISLPVILGISVNEINVLVDRTLASSIAIGGISALNYASRLCSFVRELFVVSISTVMYPVMSEMITEGNIEEFMKSISKSIIAISLFVLPTSLGTLVLSEPIVRFLFGRGAFDSQAVQLTSMALFYYSIGMIFFGFREILSRVFYSMQNTKIPMVNAAIGLLINIILNLILSKYLGIGGLALATSISAALTTILLFISLRIKMGSLGMKQIIITFLKILLASLVMCGLTKHCYVYLSVSIPVNFSLFIAICFGALFYFFIISFFKIKEVDIIIETIRNKLGRENVNVK